MKWEMDFNIGMEREMEGERDRRKEGEGNKQYGEKGEESIERIQD